MIDDVPHDDIVAVRVDAQVSCHSQAVIHHIVKDAVACRCARQTVHHMIRLVVQPITFKDFFISRFRTGNESKRSHHFPALLYTQVTLPVVDVLNNGLLAWVTTYPLVHIATGNSVAKGG